MTYNLRKFDFNSLYTCPPYLYTVVTLPWENPEKSFFYSIIHTYINTRPQNTGHSQNKTNKPVRFDNI